MNAYVCVCSVAKESVFDECTKAGMLTTAIYIERDRRWITFSYRSPMKSSSRVVNMLVPEIKANFCYNCGSTQMVHTLGFGWSLVISTADRLPFVIRSLLSPNKEKMLLSICPQCRYK